ncbi:MAG: methyltransferase domain-containing protein [Bacteroidetes bacterium]|jgi:SAM-dependent methyltransferase|nr:methyltransferase domain-containing protein [Bacteroidota bacterium]
MDLKLRAPDSDQHSLLLPEAASRLYEPYTGTLTSGNGNEYQIKGNVADLLQKKYAYSLAQKSNHFGFTASVYEDLWRTQSLSLLTGESFPIEAEKDLLTDWLHPVDNGIYLDVGCSTALYARMIKKRAPGAVVAAIDISQPMLRQARKKAADESSDLFLIRADAREAPFFAGTIDGLAMGGTLNELTDELKVLYECRRIVKKGGIFFMMHLLKSDSVAGRLLQGPAGLGGIQFWTLDDSNALFERAGFRIENQFTKGIVCFTKLIAV